MIFCNSLTLALYTYDQSDKKAEVLSQLDLAFTLTFIVEMIFKLIGLGFRLYARDRFNLFDAFIVILSTSDIIIFSTVMSN